MKLHVLAVFFLSINTCLARLDTEKLILLDTLSYIKFKPYGSNLAQYSGVYEDVHGDTWVVKPLTYEFSLKQLWCEYIASKLLELLVPEQTARIIVLSKGNTFLSGSRIIANFVMEAMLPDETYIERAEGKERLCAALLFIGEGDNNDENRGYIITENSVLAAHVDYDHAFKRFDLIEKNFKCPNIHFNTNYEALFKAFNAFSHMPFKIIRNTVLKAWSFLESNLPKPKDTFFTKQWLLQALANQQKIMLRLKKPEESSQNTLSSQQLILTYSS